MRKNIYAHTAVSAEYPPYVSLNREDDGTYSLTVRSAGNSGRDSGTTVLTAEQLMAMADAIRSMPGGEA